MVIYVKTDHGSGFTDVCSDHYYILKLSELKYWSESDLCLCGSIFCFCAAETPEQPEDNSIYSTVSYWRYLVSDRLLWKVQTSVQTSEREGPTGLIPESPLWTTAGNHGHFSQLSRFYQNHLGPDTRMSQGIWRIFKMKHQQQLWLVHGR